LLRDRLVLYGTALSGHSQRVAATDPLGETHVQRWLSVAAAEVAFIMASSRSR
jgi:hypothetical protein